MGELIGGCEAHDILPAGVGVLVDALHAAASTFAAARTLRTDIQVDILLKMLDGNKRTVVFDFHSLIGDCGNIIRTLEKERDHIRGKIVSRESKPGVIGAETDAGIRFHFTLGDDWRHNFREIVPEFLAIFKTADVIDGFHPTPHRPNQHEFKSEPVLPADDFLFLGFVVVGGCAKMTENHLWNP